MRHGISCSLFLSINSQGSHLVYKFVQTSELQQVEQIFEAIHHTCAK